VPVTSDVAVLLPGSWRRWQQAFDAFDSGDEAAGTGKSMSTGPRTAALPCNAAIRDSATRCS